MKQNIGQNIVKKQIRYDLEIISRLIAPASKILDIGCGDGELLEFLKKYKKADARGIEISQPLVTESIKKGISVIQGDGESDLEFYPDHSFDYAILSQTIQATKNPKQILQEMLRIAHCAIISLPNFTHYKNRWHIVFKGTMPVNKNLPFAWHDTPNIHFCSIRDFENLCDELGFKIKQKIFITAKHKLSNFFNFSILPNLFAEYGIFLITNNQNSLTAEEDFIFSNKIKQKINLGSFSGIPVTQNKSS
jgi:methionine biosynthesis protein MetW